MQKSKSSKTRLVITNYYTGERWYLVDLGKDEKYISEAKYLELQSEKKQLSK
ncbi:MAG: hypothetical protein KC646_10390 [Candidatus Cloacimonetes bacterium]|nr:hypothetical protein [Candidatus Cloacimonadota bacterium]